MSDPAKLRACASALRVMAIQRPLMRTAHLADWCEREAAEIERHRRELETWPHAREEGAC